MPFVYDDHCQASVIVNQAGDPEPMVWTYGLSFVGQPEPAQVDFDSASSLLLSFGRARTVSTYTHTRVDFVYRFNGDLKAATSTTGAGVGLVTGDPLPQNCAVLVRKRGAILGRKTRGRFYLPGLRESQVDGLGVITGSEVTALQTAANTLWSGFDNVGGWFASVILHDDDGASQPTTVT
jgi:hypothetical protein